MRPAAPAPLSRVSRPPPLSPLLPPPISSLIGVEISHLLIISVSHLLHIYLSSNQLCFQLSVDIRMVFSSFRSALVSSTWRSSAFSAHHLLQRWLNHHKNRSNQLLLLLMSSLIEFILLEHRPSLNNKHLLIDMTPPHPLSELIK